MTDDTKTKPLRPWLEAEAERLGLNCLGVTSAAQDRRAADHLHDFIAAGRHGTMTWMQDNIDRRADPQTLWPAARSAIAVGLSYAPDNNPLDALAETHRAAISVYAKRRDYHDVLKSRIKALARRFADMTGAEVKVFVDTAPLMEKPLAARAGLGWQGKHTNLVSRDAGSWLFLGVILTTADITPDEPHADQCGTCRRCVDVCPTDAFPAPYQLDARRCIAYLTIEHDGPIPKQFRKAIGNRVFGCDDCLAVCPWNKFAEASLDHKLSMRDGIDNPPIADLLRLDDSAFRKLFATTPVKRTGRAKVLRNALIAAGNAADATLSRDVETLLDDPDHLVRGAAVWAFQQLSPSDAFAKARAARLAQENDQTVVAEWLNEED